MKLIKFFCLIFFIAFGSLRLSEAQDDNLLNKSIIGNVHFNYNIHNLDGFSDSPLCASCLDLKDGNSLTGGLKLGILFHPERYLFGMEYRWGVIAGFDMQNVTIENDKFLGNIISGNTVTRGVVHYSADAKISTISLEPFAYFYPFRDIRSSFRLGLSLALPVIGKYDFSQKVITDNATFPDGSTESTVTGRDIPDKKIFLSIPLGFRYDLLTKGNWRLSPEIAYYLPLTNFQSESAWKISHFEIGLNAEYRLSKPVKKEVSAPKHLPLPAIPAPEVINSDIASTSDWLINGKEAETEAVVNFDKCTFKTISPAPAVFVFDKGSSTPRYVPENLPPSSGEKLILNISYLDTEEESIAVERRRNIFTYLKNKGLDTSSIKVFSVVRETEKIKYPQLFEEYDCAMLTKPDSFAFVTVKTDKEVYSLPATKVQFNIEPKSETTIEQFSGAIAYGNSNINIAGKETSFAIEAGQSGNKPEKLLLNAEYKLANSVSSASFDNALLLQYQQVSDTTINNLKISGDGKTFAQYFVAFFEFDASDAYTYETTGINELRKAVSSNKHIEIMGLTDDFGTVDYNSSLARKRVESVLRKLNIPLSKVNIVAPSQDILHRNDTVEGRMMNRSVAIRIFD